MSLKGFALFWYDFVIGDDWRIAAAVVVALVVTGLLAHAHTSAWWLLPLVVIAFLGLSLWSAARKD
jgi:hypothetical protein